MGKQGHYQVEKIETDSMGANVFFKEVNEGNYNNLNLSYIISDGIQNEIKRTGLKMECFLEKPEDLGFIVSSFMFRYFFKLPGQDPYKISVEEVSVEDEALLIVLTPYSLSKEG